MRKLLLVFSALVVAIALFVTVSTRLSGQRESPKSEGERTRLEARSHELEGSSRTKSKSEGHLGQVSIEDLRESWLHYHGP